MEIREEASAKLKLRDYGAAWPNWPTSTKTDAVSNGGEGNSKRTRATLDYWAKNWPTPAARDEKGANAPPAQRENATGRQQMDQLPNFVAHSSHQVPKILSCGPECLPKHRRLNPVFVEWLMGLPIGWSIARTGSGCSETELSHYKQRLLFECSQIVQDGS